MSINAIKIKESLDLGGDFDGGKMIAPFMQKFLKHTEGTTFLDFAQTTKDTEFSVCHAHVDFVGLDVVVGYGLEFCGWGCVEEFFEDGHVEFLLRVF
jgi:hypothetical protein